MTEVFTEILFKTGKHDELLQVLHDKNFKEQIEFHHGGLTAWQKEYITFIVQHGINVHVFDFGIPTSLPLYSICINIQGNFSSLLKYEITKEFVQKNSL